MWSRPEDEKQLGMEEPREVGVLAKVDMACRDDRGLREGLR